MSEIFKHWAVPATLLCLLCVAVFFSDMLRAQGTEGVIAGSDEENHLPRMMHVYRAQQFNPEGPLFDRTVDYWPNWWPPLTYWLGAQAFRTLGPSRQSAAAAIAFFHLIIGLAAFAVAWRFADPWTGLCAALAAMLSSSVMHFAGIIGLDLALAAMVAAAMACLLLSEGFARAAPSILFGIFCGLGMLAKITFPIFLLPAVLASLIVYRKDLNLRSWALLFVAFSSAALLASIWCFERAVLIARALFFHLVDYQTKPDVAAFHSESGTFFATDLAEAAGLGILLLIALGLWGTLIRRRAPEIVMASSVLASLAIVAAAPSNPERFWLPAIPVGLMLGCVAMSQIKAKSSRIAVAAVFVILIGGASASRIYGAFKNVPLIFPPKPGVAALKNHEEFVSAVLSENISEQGQFCIFSESDRIFHEGYLRYLVQRRRPDLQGWVWGPVHFHHRQLEDFLHRLETCETVIFRTSRQEIEKPDRQPVLRAVHLGEAHSMKHFDGLLAKGYFPKTFDIEKRLSESFAPFEYAGEMSLEKQAHDDAANRIVILRRKQEPDEREG